MTAEPFRDGRLKLGPAVPASADVPLAAGELLIGKSAVLVGTASTPLQLGTVQPVGRNPMPAADWARGLRLAPGERLG